MLKTIRGSLGTIVKWAAVALAILIVLKVIIFLYPSATKNSLVNFIYTGKMNSNSDALASSSDEVSAGEPWYRTFFSINPYPDFDKMNATIIRNGQEVTPAKTNPIKAIMVPTIDEYDNYNTGSSDTNNDWGVDMNKWEVDMAPWNEVQTDWNEAQTNWTGKKAD